MSRVEVKVEKVIKRDGRIVDFDATRIENAVRKAMLATNSYNKEILEKVISYILLIINEKYKERYPHVEEIQDIVEFSLMKYGLFETAKAYVLYRKERERIREEKKKILQKTEVDEVDKNFSINALRILSSRYLLRDEEGKIIESPKQLFQRVAALIIIPDILYDSRIFDKNGSQKIHEKEDFNPEEYEFKIGLKEIKWNRWHLERMKNLYDELNSQRKMKVGWKKFLKMLENGEFDNYYEKFMEYYRIMVEKKFMPNSPTLFNAGARLGQLSACFVLDIDDNIESIMETVKEASIIFKTGGGVGINYSKLRPEGDVVASTSGTASGPCSFMRIIDVTTDVIKQGGKRRGANMGILNASHPEIEKFITLKTTEGVLENFNISVALDKDFWDAYEKDEPYFLINPRNGKSVKKIDPKHLLEIIALSAWKTADPGVLFLDNINKRNILKKARGEITATNPCGEQPLYPYESCNLGSINLYAFIKRDIEGNVEFDWKELEKTIKIAIDFLDNVIDVNKYPLKKIEEKTKESRKIGLGMMGLADALFALKIPYNSEGGFEFMRKITEFIDYYAYIQSIEKAKERGAFPLFEKSNYVDGEMPVEGFYHKDVWNFDWNKIIEDIKKYGVRNSNLTSIAPTGTISMIVDASSGLEPQFALIFEKTVTLGKFYYVNQELEIQLRERGLYDEKIIEKIAENGGSIQEIDEIPEDLKKVFVTAYDIPWWDHIRAQYEIGLWVDAGISKTINMANWVSVEDVKNAYLFAYKLGLKGITIYRDGSKTKQVLTTPTQRRGKYLKIVENKTIDMLNKYGIKVTIEEKEEKINSLPFLKMDMPKFDLLPKESKKKAKREACPMCQSQSLVYHESCVTCMNCGWSECVEA
ncbi:MAG: adenosylcobalamin-dependent ribonucleoside-diphosphate reductase [Nitrososphaerota archaeon]